jgi:hypothetical protein
MLYRQKEKVTCYYIISCNGFERDKDILEIFDLAEEKVSKTGLKKIYRKLAARVLNTWHEDFVDEDTGEVVSIERNEIILDRDTLSIKIMLKKSLILTLNLFCYIRMLIKLIMPSFIIRYKRSNKPEKKLLSIFTDNCVMQNRLMKKLLVVL